MYRYRRARVEVFLVHPGGPFWAHKDAGAWSIPKGEFADDEEPLQAARREFEEETGFSLSGDFVALAPLQQPSGKWIHAWALQGDCDAGQVRSNTCMVEWPPHSGRSLRVPEVDRAAWLPLPEAALKLLRGQRGFLTQLEAILTRPT